MGKLLKFPGQGATPKPDQMSGNSQSMAARVLPDDGSESLPNVIPMEAASGQEIPDFTTFHRKIHEGDLVSAGELLSFLLGITHFQGIESARAYRFLDRKTSTAQEKVRSLFDSLGAGKTNECLMILSDCFGIGGSRAVLVLQHLKAQS